MENLTSENGGRPSIPVACPRCQSLNTKFCYFNNHNVNQPRHFCRDCQRYWTAGGSLRNVPVGAGKRKHKGPLASTAKMENLPNMFCFSGTHLDQGVYTPSLESPSVLSLKQHAGHNHIENKVWVETTPSESQSAFVGISKTTEASAVASRQDAPGSYGELNAFGKHDPIGSQGPEKIEFSEGQKKPSLALGLNLAKDTEAREYDAKPISHTNGLQDFPSLPHGAVSLPPQYVAERDESTVCSSVTANLGCSGAEAYAESTAPSTKAPTLPPVDHVPPVLNPMTAWGASMCPPWLWPFVMSNRNVTPPAGMPQLDPTYAAAMSAMAASMSPMNPAFAAAMGAMASGSSLPQVVPQVDPNVMAAFTASFLQLPHLWNPYAWSLPWNAAWNMTNAGASVANGVSKRPASPTQEQVCAVKVARKDYTDETTHTNRVQASEAANAPHIMYRSGCFDVFHSKGDAFQCKDTATQQYEEGSDRHHLTSSHVNPAAQARSAAFHEGN